VGTAAPPTVSTEARESLPHFTLRQRIVLWLISWAGFLIIRLLGPTLRCAESFEDGAPAVETRPMIVSFWHNCIFPATYLYRNLAIRVMSSDSFDGEWTGRIIRKFGFVKVRGSSSKGAIRGLIGMRREVERGWSVAFTIDGPRGPRYVAKPGPVLLARSTGAPMAAFYVAIDRAWTLRTWDRCLIPKPFSRVLLRMSQPIFVPADGDRERFLGELQAALERVRQFAQENVGKVGSAEFPVVHRNPPRSQQKEVSLERTGVNVK
jgi:lysophospholipid acyltransferase (LPLAT)-like uncharacterized protein